MKEPPECKDAFPPAASFTDCGPVRPTTALGGRIVAIVKSWGRFAATVPARSLDWCQSFTLVTFCTMLFLVTCHTMASLSFIDPGTACLSTAGVIYNLQVYRVFLYGSFHSSFLHLIINMIFLGSAGKIVEGKLGSYYFLNVVLVFGATCAAVQLLLEFPISFVYPAIAENCLSGFSGVLFGVLVLALCVTKAKRQSVYGCCYIPKALYPWLLVLVCQLITYDHISVTSNVAGIIVGYAYINDLLNILKLSPIMILNLERAELCQWFKGLPGFVHYPKSTLIPFANPVRQRRKRSADKRVQGRAKKSKGGTPSATASGASAKPASSEGKAPEFQQPATSSHSTLQKDMTQASNHLAQHPQPSDSSNKPANQQQQQNHNTT